MQQLMTYRLLRGAFCPAEQVCMLRPLYRQRGMPLRSQGRPVQHMPLLAHLRDTSER